MYGKLAGVESFSQIHVTILGNKIKATAAATTVIIFLFRKKKVEKRKDELAENAWACVWQHPPHSLMHLEICFLAKIIMKKR